ncbi:hypothetical protein [Aquabacterium sp.]|uniref:hypothetical protein n=1 Tax=Aquabacterium sp. TaxID=1872578 RepID=UPI0024870D06|nr:hypothetical protein [Aquabacterium sp.]MDI1261116.1 hypothetical protein [Aquabacterium sp.]
MKNIVVATVMACFTLSVWAHGGEDHDEPASAPVQVGQAPRAVAQTEDFELVAVLTGNADGHAGGAGATTAPVLTLYLDRFATNVPVAGATVELESGAFKAVAKQTAPGVYTVSGQAFARPGRYPLTVSVDSIDGADLLDTTLQYDAPVAKADASAHPVWRAPWAWGLGGALLLSAAGVTWGRRRARNASIRG